MSIGFSGIEKKYGDKSVAEAFTLLLQEGKTTCLMGPSGCGKTTLLNIFSGLSDISKGELIGKNDRRISYIFQEPRLIPFMSVRENIALVMNQTDSEKISQLLAQLELNDSGDLYPSELSGGMQQRVSVARALAYAPDIILADEPANGLDIMLKDTLYRLLQSYCKDNNATMLMVTHDPIDCIRYADEAVVLCGPPLRILLTTSVLQTGKEAQIQQITSVLEQCTQKDQTEY